MSFHSHSLNKITRIDSGSLQGNFFYFQFLLQQLPKTQFHLQAVYRQQRVTRFRLHCQHIAHQKVERKTQVKSAYMDVQSTFD